MVDLQARIAVVAPKIPDFENAKYEAYAVDDYHHKGIGVDMMWFHSTSDYPELFQQVGGVLIEGVNSSNYPAWEELDKKQGVIAGWDRVVANAVHAAAALELPLFTKTPTEEVGYYDFIDQTVIGLEGSYPFEGKRSAVLKTAEFITIERGYPGAQTMLERLAP